jgi:hypothetical protein
MDIERWDKKYAIYKFYSNTYFCIAESSCHVCSKFGAVLAADTSGEEYEPICICLSCIQKGFEEFEKEENS